MQRTDDQLLQRTAWAGVLTAATVISTLALGCATPFAALVALSAVFFPRKEAFALVGVNADETDKREKARKATRDERMDWPSFWDGGYNGPTQARYNIDHYPTVYVLDAKGVIRYIDAEGKDLDRAVDALVRESESGSKRDADG